MGRPSDYGTLASELWDAASRTRNARYFTKSHIFYPHLVNYPFLGRGMGESIYTKCGDDPHLVYIVECIHCMFCLIFRAPKNCVVFWEGVNSKGILGERNVHSNGSSCSNTRSLSRSSIHTRSTGCPRRANSTSSCRCCLCLRVNCRCVIQLRAGRCTCWCCQISSKLLYNHIHLFE